ncbi:MAG: DUF1700 domain-containing protein [Lachnospira sp.]
MTKEQYINQLNYNLRKMNETERLEAVRYYCEYLDDAYENGGEANLCKVMDELGNPKKLAGQILADSAIRKLDNDNGSMKAKDKASNVWIIVLAILASPIWSPLVFVAFILVLVAFIVVISLVIAAVSIVIAGVSVVAGGAIVTFTHIPTAILMAGLGLVCLGIGIFAMILTIKLLTLLCKGVVCLVRKIFGKQRG